MDAADGGTLGTLGTLGIQELRLAATFTGGVSLAVWMGGVAHEMNLLAAASRTDSSTGLRGPGPRWTTEPAREVAACYTALLDLLRIEVSIDVLSGTSAGGINAGVLGLATARGCDLEGLRQVWLDEGAMGSLLRDPARRPAPSSLLQGDTRLLTGLTGGIAHLASPSGREPAPPPDSPVRVFITTTLLAGQRNGFRDGFGTVVDDADHHGLFDFRAEQLVSDESLRPLALASRCSASFPAAFEPGFVPIGADVGALPDMAPYTDLTRSGWVADGGLLNNRPLRPALEAVFDRPAGHDVRRVLAYVVPSASVPQEATAADFAQPYGVGRALLADLGAATSQTIADELRDIERHNDAVRGQRQVRDAVLDAGMPAAAGPGQLAAYRTRRATAIARPVSRALARQWSGAPGGEGPRGMDVLRIREVAEAWSLERLPASTPQAGAYDRLAAFGRDTFDGARSVVLTLVREALALPLGTDVRAGLLTLRHEVGATLPGPRPAAGGLRELAARLGGDAASDEAVRQVMEAWVALAHPETLLTSAWRDLAWLCRDPRLTTATAPAPADSPVGRLRALLDADDGEVAVRLFGQVVAGHALTVGGPDVEQSLELVQMSADTRTLLDLSRSRAGSKLTGLQLHHFGAFYKRSWRANDWMWGRVDGVGWLVHVLLDPRRVLAVARRRPDPRSWVLTELRATLERVAGCPPTPEALAQLGELADAAARAPGEPGSQPFRNLGPIALWVARGPQELLAREELPWVAQQAALDEAQGGRRGAARDFVTACHAQSVPATGTAAEPPPVLRRDADVAGLFRACRVSDETFAGERTSPLFLRTATQTLAVSAAMAADVGSSVRAAAPALRTLRGATLLAWRASRVRGNAVLLALALLVAGALAATSSYAWMSGTGVVAVGAGILLLSVRVSRLPGLAVGLALVLVVLLGTAAFFPWPRDRLASGLEQAAQWLPEHPVVWGLVVLFLLLPPLTTAGDLLLAMRRRPRPPRAAERRLPGIPDPRRTPHRSVDIREDRAADPERAREGGGRRGRA